MGRIVSAELRRWLLLPLPLHLLLLHLSPTDAQEDDFAFFRCDACSATFFKVNKTLVERFRHRKKALQSFEILDLLEEICDTMFTKHEFGVKQHEGKKYLFGPGVIDHIPDQGFGQMGMGDYDRRLSAYCRMFTEEVGEDELRKLFANSGSLNKTELCRSECQSSASGTGALSARSRPPKRHMAVQATPPPRRQRPRGRPRRSPQLATSTTQAPMEPTGAAPVRATTPKATDPLEEAIGLLPRLSSRQLRWLGEAVLSELEQRASKPPTSPPLDRVEQTEL